jgi:hypothetical protein
MSDAFFRQSTSLSLQYVIAANVPRSKLNLILSESHNPDLEVLNSDLAHIAGSIKLTRDVRDHPST